MAYIRAADGTRLHYATWGDPEGEPLLLIQGLGADMRGWILQRRAMGRRFRCIALDNRGMGASDKPAGPYDLEVMAADAATVLDACGVGSAHVLGVSMGGVIAQALAVRDPGRVRSLVLACTACRHLPWRRELLARWAETARRDGMRRFVGDNLGWLVGMRSFRRIWPAVALLGPLAWNVPVASFTAQVEAILAADDRLAAELSTIRVPTLVIVGSQDILTPIGDAEELAERIPTAELAVVSGGAHLFMVEQAGQFNHTVLEFLDRITSRASAATPEPDTGRQSA